MKKSLLSVRCPQSRATRSSNGHLSGIPTFQKAQKPARIGHFRERPQLVSFLMNIPQDRGEIIMKTLALLVIACCVFPGCYTQLFIDRPTYIIIEGSPYPPPPPPPPPEWYGPIIYTPGGQSTPPAIEQPHRDSGPGRTGEHRPGGQNQNESPRRGSERRD